MKARRRIRETPVQDLGEADRGTAAQVHEATRVDRGSLWVGLACLGLLGLVVLITALKQP